MEPPRAGTSNELECHSNHAEEPPKRQTSDDFKFNCNFARLPLITKEAYDMICARDQMIREILPREFLDYYVTAILWARLLHIKYYSSTPLTAIEDEYLRKFVGKLLWLPEPIYDILTMIGHIRDFPRGSGRNLYLDNYVLPVAVVEGKGGYHSEQVTVMNVNLFAEVPSLGVSGDCVMCLASPGNPTEPKFPFLPEGAAATPNMTGYFGLAGPIAVEVRNALTFFSISDDKFKEDVAGTRLNMNIIDHVMKIIRQSTAFKGKDFRINLMSIVGSETQVIQTFPVAKTVLMHHSLNPAVSTWTQRVVQAQQTPGANGECVKRSYVTGFQLDKEEWDGDDHSNWSCMKRRDSSSAWTLCEWSIDNRNAFRYPAGRLCGQLGGRGSMWSQSVMTQEYCERYLNFKNF